MIWDLILFIKRVWKQQTCIHKYQYIVRKDDGWFYLNCEKCDRCKK